MDEKLWVIDVNDSVTHGPFPYVDAVVAQEALMSVEGVTDTVLREAQRSEVG